jgi:predicted molibdopterin-dependent oxidoreductase YjgC
VTPQPLLTRLPGLPERPLPFTLDGVACSGREGDTVLSAVLALCAVLRHTEFGAAPRAGFCAMGACQDCWMSCEDGTRLRACTTPLEAGMRLVTGRAG